MHLLNYEVRHEHYNSLGQLSSVNNVNRVAGRGGGNAGNIFGQSGGLGGCGHGGGIRGRGGRQPPTRSAGSNNGNGTPCQIVVRATMMHCSVDTALTKLIKKRIPSNKQL
jgi:hypothetical protein